jgi:hypothetical protein
MRGCLLLVIGIVLGVLLLAVFEVFVVKPAPLAQAPPANADMVILFRNQFLTRELQAQLSQVSSPITVHNPTIQGQADGTMVVTGTATASGFPVTVPVRIVAHPSVANNQVSVQIVSAEVGTLKIPGNWLRPLENQINENLNRTLANTQYRIVGVSTTVEGLVVDVVVTR